MFDAAIQILRNWVIFGQGENKQSAEAAIRVLEAAAKVDKRQAEAWLDAAHAGCPDYDVKDDIRALFAAIPDGVK